MQRNPPTELMKILLRDVDFRSKVTYLEGNALNKKDLKRCLAEDSNGLVVIANKMCTDPDMEDYKNIIQTHAVKNYVLQNKRKDIRVCLQLLKAKHKQIFYQSLDDYNNDDLVICVEQLKMYLLGKSCLCAGMTAILTSFITSYVPKSKEINLKENEMWRHEYIDGLSNDIHRITLDQNTFVGISFIQVAMALYQDQGIILIAIEVEIQDEMKLFLNPEDYIFQNKPHTGYCLSNQPPDLEKLRNFSFADHVVRIYNTEDIIMKTKRINQQTPEKHFYSESRKRQKLKKTELSYQNKSFYFGSLKSLQEATISQFTDNQFEDHVVICGFVPEMKNLLMPLRSKRVEKIHKVIILHHEQMPAKIWRQVNRFPEIYFLQGSPLKREYLEKACVQKAKCVVIVSRGFDGNQDDQNKNSTDADTIVIYKTIQHICQDNPVQIITELISKDTISFLTKKRSEMVESLGVIMSEPFASGEIYISTMMDQLMCHSFYNPKILEILNQMIMGDAFITAKETELQKIMKLEKSSLYLISVPQIYFTKTFGDLFVQFIQEYKVLCIGLYRAGKKKGNNHQPPYVYLKPPPDLMIESYDKMYLLSSRKPYYINDPIKKSKKLNIYTSKSHLKSKLGGDAGKKDLEMAKELQSISLQMRKSMDHLKQLEHTIFAQNLSQRDLIPKIRSILRKELGSLVANTQPQ